MNKHKKIIGFAAALLSTFYFLLSSSLVFAQEPTDRLREIRIFLPRPQDILERVAVEASPIERVVTVFKQSLSKCFAPAAPTPPPPKPACGVTLNPENTDATKGRYNGRAVCNGYSKNLDCVLIGRAESPLGVDKQFITFGGITSRYNFKGTVKEGGKHIWTLYSPFGKECETKTATRSSICSLTVISEFAEPSSLVSGEGKYTVSADCTGVNSPCRLDNPTAAAGQFSGSRDFPKQIPPNDPIGLRKHRLFGKSDNYKTACNEVVVSRLSADFCQVKVDPELTDDGQYDLSANCLGNLGPCTLQNTAEKIPEGGLKRRESLGSENSKTFVLLNKAGESCSEATVTRSPGSCGLGISNVTGSDYKVVAQCTDAAQPCSLNISGKTVVEKFLGIHKKRYNFVNPSGDKVVAVSETPVEGEAIKCEAEVKPVIIGTERVVPAECSFRVHANPTGQDGSFRTAVTCKDGSIESVSPCKLILYDNTNSRSTSAEIADPGVDRNDVISSKGPVTVTLLNKDSAQCKEEIVHKPRAGQVPLSPVSCPSISISTVNSDLTSGTDGAAYNSTLTASGGTGGLTWTITSGNLPPQVALASSTGGISGDIPSLSSDCSGGSPPSVCSPYNFTAQVSDSCSSQQSTTQTLQITVNSF